MIIDDNIFNQYIGPLIKAGLEISTNTKYFYDVLNNHQASQLIVENKVGIPQFYFLKEILDNQELTKCPMCGHYNDNIECPIIRCEICDHEWRVHTEHSECVCKECIARRTDHCKPNDKESANGNDKA